MINIDLLDSKEVDAVAKWLATYANIELVSRDGSLQYAAAITQAHPNAIQVSDRFHVIKNIMVQNLGYNGRMTNLKKWEKTLLHVLRNNPANFSVEK